jgi:hypothetical protein
LPSALMARAPIISGEGTRRGLQTSRLASRALLDGGRSRVGEWYRPSLRANSGSSCCTRCPSCTGSTLAVSSLLPLCAAACHRSTSFPEPERRSTGVAHAQRARAGVLARFPKACKTVGTGQAATRYGTTPTHLVVGYRRRCTRTTVPCLSQPATRPRAQLVALALADVGTAAYGCRISTIQRATALRITFGHSMSFALFWTGCFLAGFRWSTTIRSWRCLGPPTSTTRASSSALSSSATLH